MPRITLIALALAVLATLAQAQDTQQAESPLQHGAAPTGAWTWSLDANLFFGYNKQQRLFADFSAWESQNWGMLTAERPVPGGRLILSGMLSLEPFTIPKQGSPQLYQTGESYQQVPLVNYQHPHDLLMGLGATYRVERPRVAYVFTADLVGTPALGPTPFMHRASARNNPQVPLAHNFLDSTHLTPGVLRAGVEVGSLTVEASTFRGEEPDDNHLDINRPRLDSWSARIKWQRGPWQAQVSGASLHEPEWFEPYDVDRYTASIAFTGTNAGRPLAVTAAWGKNIDYNGFDNNSDGYLVEWDFGATSKSWVYGRAERAIKQIVGLGFHPKGFNHRHSYSTVDAVTAGFMRDLWVERWGRVGVGADATAYGTSPDMVPLYEGSHSYHVFLRWRPNAPSLAHIH